MPIQPPDYSDPALEAFSVCARIEDEDILMPQRHQSFESRTEAPGGVIWIRTISNPQEDPHGIHIHMDSIREPLYDPDERPEDPDPPDRTLSHFDEYMGREVFANLTARFSVPIETIRKRDLIYPALIKSNKDDAPIRLIGIRLEMRDSAIVDEIEWRIVERDNREYVIAEIIGSTSIDLEPSFPSDALDGLTEMFRWFVPPKRRRVKE